MISIIMGLYNAEDTISEAIDSIINQTFKEWELIICNDGSTDNGAMTVEQYVYKDSRIKLIHNEKNMGLNYTLNHCLEYASGEYIARMDADDISLPTRLEKEFMFLETNKEYSIVSTPMIYFDENGDFAVGKAINNPTILDVMKGTPFCHAPCLVRKEAYDNVGGYSLDSNTLRVEDYDLWVKMLAEGYKGYNLDEPLYKMRDDRNAYRRRKYIYRINEAFVKIKAFKLLRPPFYSIIYIFRPLLVGLLPSFIYKFLHKKKINSK